jgi:hypothetical protein
MSNRDIYTVKYTALVSGWASYSIPEGDKIRHFVDGSSEIEWDFDSVRDIEMGDTEFSHTEDDGEYDGEEEVEDNDGSATREEQSVEGSTFTADDIFPF